MRNRHYQIGFLFEVLNKKTFNQGFNQETLEKRRKLRLFELETVRAQSRKQLDSMKKDVCTRTVTIRLNRLIEQDLIVATGKKHDLSRTYDCYIPVDVLRSGGTPLPVAAADFKAYLQQELIDTAGAAELMGCTRQNIQDLVRRGRMRPVITLRNNFLFLRSEL